MIATACGPDELSHARSNLLYDEFVYHWISAVAGKTPEGTIVNADYNPDGYITAYEAFLYANTKDSKSETPQYSSMAGNYGKFISLKGLKPHGWSYNLKILNGGSVPSHVIPDDYAFLMSSPHVCIAGMYMARDLYRGRSWNVTRTDDYIEVEFFFPSHYFMNREVMPTIIRHETMVYSQPNAYGEHQVICRGYGDFDLDLGIYLVDPYGRDDEW
ncbi:MAG: hypothetical protein LUF85_02470 [Bacteroides sp.]|nr:hypothetical protein [Bacteroides sp.]